METSLDTTKAENQEGNASAARRMTGAEAVIESLIAEGVDTIFGYPGGAIMPIYDALYGYQDQVKHILTRHEQGATHAAEGYSRVSNKTSVCFATSGPGATNLVTGLADALLDSTPMVCITGQVPKHLLGTDAFQEVDVVGITTPCTKWAYQVTSAEEIPWAIARAFFIANTGRPGPVLIDITKNAQFEDFDFEYKKCTHIRSYCPKPKLNVNRVKEAAELINNAKRPYILIGHGVLISEAQEELKQLMEKAGIPGACTLLGLSAIATDHPLYVGYLGMHGNYGPNVLTNECDVLIAIGMRFDDRVTGDLSTYAKQAKVIHIEIDKAEIDKNVKTEVAVVADAKEALEALIPMVNENSHDDWVQKFRECDKIEFEKVIAQAIQPAEGKIRMSEVIHRISDLTEGQSILVTDVGQHQMEGTRYYKFKDTLTNVSSGGAGTMGFALPAAIGAKMARPDKEVIAIIGDGAFQMTIQELGTIFQTQERVKIVVLNNEFLGMVRQWQQLFFDKRYSSTEMTNPDFVAIAKGYHVEAKRVSEREDLESSLQEMLDFDGSYFLEIMVEKESCVFPMVPSGASVSDILLEPKPKAE